MVGRGKCAGFLRSEGIILIALTGQRSYRKLESRMNFVGAPPRGAMEYVQKRFSCNRAVVPLGHGEQKKSRPERSERLQY